MEIFYVVCAALLLLLNAFFVFAEFAAVKIRASRIEEMIDQGRTGAKIVKHIHAHLDQYLSVCQVGITVASIALGIVIEPLAAKALSPVVTWLGLSDEAAHRIVIGVGLFVISFVHVTLGEQVPKLIAIRAPDTTSLWTAAPLQWFRWLFFVPLWMLNAASTGILRLFGLSDRDAHDQHSEDELRILLSHGHSGGVFSFRRLLFMENIFDFGDLRVRDAMRTRANVRSLNIKASWADNEKIVRESRYSRFPVIDPGVDRPIGVIHVKDLYLQRDLATPDLTKLARPFLATSEDTSLENLLAEMQRRRIHVGIVFGKDGRWTGFISMEDIIEELIGTVEDEFATDPPIYLGDVLTPGRVVLGVEADTIQLAISSALSSVRPDELPLPAAGVIAAVLDREKMISTYLGNGIAMPHARLPNLTKPALIFARSDNGVPLAGRDEKIHIFFILLTPAGLPRVHQRLQARIAGILDSDFVETRLREAATPAEVLEAIRIGEQTSLD